MKLPLPPLTELPACPGHGVVSEKAVAELAVLVMETLMDLNSLVAVIQSPGICGYDLIPALELILARVKSSGTTWPVDTVLAKSKLIELNNLFEIAGAERMPSITLHFSE